MRLLRLINNIMHSHLKLQAKRMATKRRGCEYGVTIVEVIVALVLFGVMMIALTLMISAMQQSQRNEQYLDLANTAAKAIIEDARNGKYDALNPGSTYTRTDMVSDRLPSKSASLEVTQPTAYADHKQVKVTVSYLVGSEPKSVVMTAMISERGGI